MADPEIKTVLEGFRHFVQHYHGCSLEDLKAEYTAQFIALRDAFFSGTLIGFSLCDEAGSDEEAKNAILTELDAFLDTLKSESAALETAKLVLDEPEGHT